MSRRILVVGPSWVGDMVMAQPLVHQLSGGGKATVDMLVPPWVMGLAARMPGVTDAMASPFGHGELALGRRWRLGRDISRRGYDQAVILPNSLKSALVPWFAGIARRTGFRGEMRWGVLNDIRALDRTSVPRLVDRFLLLADSAPSIPPMPQLRTDETRQRQLLERLRLDVSRPVAGLCPGAEFGPAKRWPPRHFAALAVQLIERGMRIWLLGSSRDAAIATEIEAQCPEAVVNLCGRTTLEDAVDLLAACSVVVSNDSGLMHVAAAVGRPVIALFGSSSPEYTPPLSATARIVRNPVPCSPCFKRECPLRHFDCLDGLLPATVVAQVETAMELPR